MATIGHATHRAFINVLAITVAAAILVVAVSISTFAPGQQVSVPEVVPVTPEPTATATAIPSATPAPTAVPTPTPTPTAAPTPSPTPENRPGQAGTCLVLEQQYCNTGVRVLRNAYVGFRLPPGAMLFEPFDGWKSVSTATFLKSGGKYTRVKVFVSPDGDLEKSPLDVTFTPAVNIPTAKAVKKGQVVGRVSSTTVSEAG
ncbi:MAG TPA: hypothetical protein VI954_00795, partial [Candidatus Paceibacterota bacterium]